MIDKNQIPIVYWDEELEEPEMNITNVVINEAEDYPALANFYKYMLEHFGVRSIKSSEFLECIEEIADDCEDDYEDEIWDHFKETLYDGEIIENDQEKCVETLSFGDEIGTCDIDGKPHIISYIAHWQSSPYFSIEETMHWSSWRFELRAKEIYNTKNQPSGTIKLQRKPQELNGFVLTSTNVDEFYKWLQSQLPELTITNNKDFNQYDGYKTKSHTRTEVQFTTPDEEDFDDKYDLIDYFMEFRINNFHYVDYTKDGQPFIHVLSKEEIDEEYDIV